MTILIEVSEFDDLGRLPAERVPVLALPPLKAKRYTAAGRTDAFQPESRVFRIRNNGDDVWFRVLKLTEDDHAADDNYSLWLQTGDVYDFMLPADELPASWQIDVRARS